MKIKRRYDMKPNYVKEMRRLVLLAGKQIMRIYNSDDLKIRKKKDRSAVTMADEAADAIISKGLLKKFPDINVVTEEQAKTHLDYHKKFFIVDPLDGTREFISGSAEFTVNIALVENNVPILGVVYAPALERLFYTKNIYEAVEEIGPFSESTFGSRRRLVVARPDNGALIVVASKSHSDAETLKFISKYSVASSKSAGSSLKFCLLAAGAADLYPRLGRTMEWDTASGDALLRAAGGKVVDFETRKPLIYGKDGYQNPPFIAFAEGVELKDI